MWQREGELLRRNSVLIPMRGREETPMSEALLHEERKSTAPRATGNGEGDRGARGLRLPGRRGGWPPPAALAESVLTGRKERARVFEEK